MFCVVFFVFLLRSSFSCSSTSSQRCMEAAAVRTRGGRLGVGARAHSCGRCGETLWVPTTKPGGHNFYIFVLLCICTFMLLDYCVLQYYYRFVLLFVCVCMCENGLAANKGKGFQPRGTPCDALPADLCHPCLPPALVCPFHPKDNARCYTVSYKTKPN